MNIPKDGNVIKHNGSKDMGVPQIITTRKEKLNKWKGIRGKNIVKNRITKITWGSNSSTYRL